MKKMILILMFILIPSALAIYGGETWLYHFDYCDRLLVNITANQTIDEGEYTIHNECEGKNNSFVCNCSNDFDFNVSFEINKVNDYDFEFNYDYSKEVVETTETTGGSSGGGGGRIFNVDLKGNKKFKAILVRNVNSYFSFDGIKHRMKMVEVKEDWIRVEIKSDPIVIDLYVNETKVIEIDNELLEIYLEKIQRRVAFIYLRQLEKAEVIEPAIEDVAYIANETTLVEELPTEEAEEPTEYVGVLADEPEKKGYGGLLIVIAISLVIIGLVAFFYFKDGK